MGLLILSGDREPTEFDDRFLAHFQVVFVAKQRRREGVLLTWADGISKGSKRHSVWLPAPSIVEFVYFGSKQPPLNRIWLDQMSEQAASQAGVMLGPEPAPPAA